MATVTIASRSINGWHRPGAYLRIYVFRSFKSADGKLVPQVWRGKPYLAAEFQCSVSGDVLTIPAIELESTEDSDDRSARYQAAFTDQDKRELDWWYEFREFKLPATPTSTTWAAIKLAQ